MIELPENPKELEGRRLKCATSGMVIEVEVTHVHLDPLESDPPRIYVRPVHGEGTAQVPRSALFPLDAKV